MSDWTLKPSAVLWGNTIHSLVGRHQSNISRSSVSIACWLVVFSPQIIENFRRSSAEGLSLSFLLIWLLGDLFNILGGIFQGVLPTMLILAIYYTLADIVLLAQVLYYSGFLFGSKTSKDLIEESTETMPTETSPLMPRIASPTSERRANSPRSLTLPDGQHNINSFVSLRRSSSATSHSFLHNGIDGVHLSPATPLRDQQAEQTLPVQSALQSTIFNIGAVLLVCLAGVAGWYLSELRSQQSSYNHTPTEDGTRNEDLEFDTPGQVFGYLCAVLYLGSRIPQILLNHRRKSTEGVSMLFFLFACIGNLTYVLSIFAYEPACAKLGRTRGYVWDYVPVEKHHSPGRYFGCTEGQWAELYERYIWINLSWLIGSAGTLLLDLAVFAQFWIYHGNTPVSDSNVQ